MLRQDLTIARAEILDPAITLHAPQSPFLPTGIRAFDHCVEAPCSQEAYPYAGAQALEKFSMLAQGQPRVKANPRKLDGPAQVRKILLLAA